MTGVPADSPIRFRVSTRARRLSIRIDPVSREIVVTRPAGTLQEQAMAFVEARRDWLANALSTLPRYRGIEPGSVITLNDRSLTVTPDPAQIRTVHERDGLLIVRAPADRLAIRVLCYARQEASCTLPVRLEYWADLMQCSPSAVICRDARSRWGSCSRTGRIMLNWRLVLMPRAVRDYVLVHELAHLKHFDHGKRFWALVDRFHPARAHAQTWLKQNGAEILAL